MDKLTFELIAINLIVLSGLEVKARALLLKHIMKMIGLLLYCLCYYNCLVVSVFSACKFKKHFCNYMTSPLSPAISKLQQCRQWKRKAKCASFITFSLIKES